MSDRLVPILSWTALVLACTYIALVVATISFATWQTQQLAEIREVEGSIASIETAYYEAIARINRTDPSAHGLATPHSVRYVTAVSGTNVTFAGR
ncbi:MAG TPA: hypothetical protein VNU47_00300 [Candidatus Paceibacterota bacterium]|nr:hypothetical protein [Candidatus Paceibacterota bacterium]